MSIEGWFGRSKETAKVPQTDEARYRLIETDDALREDVNQLRMALRSSDMPPSQDMVARVANKLGLSAEEVMPFVKAFDEADTA